MSTSPTPEERDKKDKKDRAREAEEQSKLPYKWTQTIRDLDITVSVPPTLRGKDILVEMKKTHLKVGICGQEPIIDGPLPHEIHPPDSTWTLETTPSAKEIALHLEKTHKQQWWASVTTNAAYFLDTAKITPENSRLGDLDGETRGMVEKMMWDQRQKELGRPTSEEEGKIRALEGFKKMHPEMDFSGARMG